MSGIFDAQRASGNAVFGAQRSAALTGPGTLTSSWITWNDGAPHVFAPFICYVSDVDSGALILKKTGLTAALASDGVHYQCAFADAALVRGTWYAVRWRRADIGAPYGINGFELLQAQ